MEGGITVQILFKVEEEVLRQAQTTCKVIEHGQGILTKLSATSFLQEKLTVQRVTSSLKRLGNHEAVTRAMDGEPEPEVRTAREYSRAFP